MACLVTQGRLVACKDGIGGLYKIFLANFGAITPVLSASNVITNLSAATLYEYELKGVSKFTQDFISSRENGVSYVNQTLTIDLQGVDFNTNNEIKLMAYGRPQIIVQDNTGAAFLAGRLRGLDLTSGVNDSGGALSEKRGYLLTLVGMENEYANYLSGSTIANPFAGMAIAPTVIKGT
jgi:hypothetical protein